MNEYNKRQRSRSTSIEERILDGTLCQYLESTGRVLPQPEIAPESWRFLHQASANERLSPFSHVSAVNAGWRC
jgi:hypothetical protein